MKKYLSVVFASLVSLLLATACGEPETRWDYPNADISISVRDAKGNNILDLSREIKIEYNGETYPMAEIELPTRAEIDRPEWLGLRWNNYLGGNAGLLFGEFSIDTRNYHDESFVIYWGDGTSDEISFDFYATFDDGDKQPDIHRATRLNGELNSGNSLTVKVVK